MSSVGFRVIRLFSVRCCKSTTIFQTTKTPICLTCPTCPTRLTEHIPNTNTKKQSLKNEKSHYITPSFSRTKTQIRQTLQRSPKTLPFQCYLHRPIRRFRLALPHCQNHSSQRPRNMERLRQLRSPIGTHTHYQRNHRPIAPHYCKLPQRNTHQ